MTDNDRELFSLSDEQQKLIEAGFRLKGTPVIEPIDMHVIVTSLIRSNPQEAIDDMLQAQDLCDGVTTYSDPLSFKDAADIFIAMAEAAPAVKPAQAVPAFWANENILKDSLRDNISCILTTTRCSANTVPLYTTPPAIVEAVPVGRVLHWKGDPGFAPKTCIRGFDEYPKGYAQLGPWEEGENVYTVPQAIDNETRHRLILVCEYLETVGLMFVSPRVISSQIRAILEAGE